jgi:hypothetical protein
MPPPPKPRPSSNPVTNYVREKYDALAEGASKLTLYDPFTGKPIVPITRTVGNRTVPAPLPEIPGLFIQPDIPKPDYSGVPLMHNAAGDVFVVPRRKAEIEEKLPKRVTGLTADLPDYQAPAKAPRGTILNPADLPLSLRGLEQPAERDLPIPGWEDLLRLDPLAPLTPEQKRARAIQRAADLKAAALPAWRQGLAQIHGALDDVEDLLTTAVVVGRVALRRFPRLLGKLSYLSAASDIINGVEAALALPTLRVGKLYRLKRELGRNPYTSRGRLKIASNLKRLIPTFGETLEVAQTTADLFGVGIVLGPLYGAVDEGLARMQAGQPLFTQQERLGPRDRAAADAMASALSLMQQDSPISNTDYLRAQTVVNVSLDQLRGADTDRLARILKAARTRSAIKPPGGTYPETRQYYELHQELPQYPEPRFPGSWETEVDPLSYGEHLRHSIRAEWDRRMSTSFTPTEAALSAELVSDAAESFIKLYEGEGAIIETTQAPSIQALITLAEAGLQLDPARDRAHDAELLDKLDQVNEHTARPHLQLADILNLLQHEGIGTTAYSSPTSPLTPGALADATTR